jgi:hypothetical protein
MPKLIYLNTISFQNAMAIFMKWFPGGKITSLQELICSSGREIQRKVTIKYKLMKKVEGLKKSKLCVDQDTM